MKPLILTKCKTNKAVCEAISDRVNSITYEDLLSEVNKVFVNQEEATKAIYTGLSESMNVFLSGPGGYGKSTLIKFILDYFKIPYSTIVGYKDMPVDALLGIPDMNKLLTESKYELNFKESPFYVPGVLIGEEFTDILPSTAAALKDILTEKGLRGKNGKIESLISCMIVAANKSAKEIVDDESKKAFYEERFPITVDIRWKSFTDRDYLIFLIMKFPDADKRLLYFMARLFEDNHVTFNNTISPRVAADIAKVYLNKGIKFIRNFPVILENIDKIEEEAERDFSTLSYKNKLDVVLETIENIEDKKDMAMACLYILDKLGSQKVTDIHLNNLLNTKTKIRTLLQENIYLFDYKESLDITLNNIVYD